MKNDKNTSQNTVNFRMTEGGIYEPLGTEFTLVDPPVISPAMRDQLKAMEKVVQERARQIIEKMEHGSEVIDLNETEYEII